MTRKIPMRKCVGCNEMKPKKELIRVLKTSEGDFAIDFTGKQNGRGAYICNDRKCFEAARKSRALERSFKCKIAEGVYDSLKEALNE